MGKGCRSSTLHVTFLNDFSVGGACAELLLLFCSVLLFSFKSIMPEA